MFSITRTDGGTDGIIVNGSGNVGINTNIYDDKLHVNDGNIFQEQTNGLIFFGKDGGGSNTNSPNTIHWIGRIDNAGYHAVGSDGGFSGVAGSLGIGAHGSIMFATQTATTNYASGRMLIATNGNIGISQSNLIIEQDFLSGIPGSTQSDIVAKLNAGTTTNAYSKDCISCWLF